MDRRTLLKTAAALPLSVARVRAANDRIRLGVIGAGSRGRLLMDYASQIGGVEWIAAADVYGPRRDAVDARVKAKVDKYVDYRRVLDRKDIDAVIIAAPDHWHAKMLLDAVAAGKDVFCEKPMTTEAIEGHAIVKAVREAKRIVQIGTQQRSIAVVREAKARFIDSGVMGQITMVHCYWGRNGGYLAPRIPEEFRQKPADLDWDQWLGPLPKIPYDPLRFLRAFLFWGSSTGPTGNLLVHYLDIVHWYLGLKRPDAASAMGAIYHYKDGRDVPDTFSSILRYPEGVQVAFDCCVVDTSPQESTDLVFIGSGGRLHVFREGYRFLPSQSNKALGTITAPGEDGPLHVQNWLECIRTRQEPNCGVVDSHYLAAACHLANTSYFENRRVAWKDAWDLAAA